MRSDVYSIMKIDFTVQAVAILITVGAMRMAWGQAGIRRELVVNPYETVDWERVGHYRANLHTHTTESDGRLEPARVIDEYHARGYSVLAITDHDRATWPWQAFGRDADRLGMLPIAGNELSRHHHTLSLFADFETQERDHEAALRGVADAGGLAVLCHPAMHWVPSASSPPSLRVTMTEPWRQLTQGDFTVEAWFRTRDAGRNILMGNFKSGRPGALNLELHTQNRIRVYLQPPEGRTVDLNVAADRLDTDTRDGNWHHLAAVRRGDTVVLYLDGKEAGRREDTAKHYDLQGNDYFIGRDTRTGSTAFLGALDAVRLWTRARSDSEIAASAAGLVPTGDARTPGQGLLARYDFEGVGEGMVAAGTQIDDTAAHPRGPFAAVALGTKSLTTVTDVADRLRRTGLSQRALNFAKPEMPRSVPGTVVESYAGLFRRHPHLTAMEVFNGTRPGREMPLDRELWDGLLATLMPQRPVWGMANDDMHSMRHLGRDWMDILAVRLDDAAVRAALVDGTYLFSTIRGHDRQRASPAQTPRIVHLGHDADGGRIVCRAVIADEPAPDDVYRWVADGRTVHVGPTLDYRNTPGIGTYVRLELVAEGGTTYTNPFGFKR